jgi:hypothetical protein
MAFERSATNDVDVMKIHPGLYTNAFGQELLFEENFLFRSETVSSNYFGLIFFDDGDLTTPGADYYDWVVSIQDPNDVNSNEVPDLSDTGGADPDPIPEMRFTSIRKEGVAVVLQWEGAGNLQAADQVAGPWTDVPGASSPHQVTPAEAQGFFRLSR